MSKCTIHHTKSKRVMKILLSYFPGREMQWYPKSRLSICSRRQQRWEHLMNWSSLSFQQYVTLSYQVRTCLKSRLFNSFGNILRSIYHWITLQSINATSKKTIHLKTCFDWSKGNGPEPCYSKCSPQSRSTSITWMLVRKVTSGLDS